jgi:hypothetical protein
MSQSPRRSPRRDRRDASPPFPKSSDEEKFKQWAREARDQDRVARDNGIHGFVPTEDELRQVWRNFTAEEKKRTLYQSRLASEGAGVRPPKEKLMKVPRALHPVAPAVDPDLVPFNEERPDRVRPRQIVREFFRENYKS